MTTTSSPKLITAEELLALSANGFRGELVRGELIEEMPPGLRHNKVMGLITYVLMSFVLPRGLGTVLPGDTGVVVERLPDTVRGPDVAFYSTEKLDPEADIPGYAEVLPDLAVEIRSPNDSLTDMERRARMWLGYGVRLVWVAHPETRRVDVYRADRDTKSFAATGQLTGEDVLPDFHCLVGDMFSISR